MDFLVCVDVVAAVPPVEISVDDAFAMLISEEV